jgi:hypothetical protein
VEDPLHPAGRAQVNVYGAVSPVADAVHVKALPAVAVPHVTLGTRVDPATFAVVEAEALLTLLVSLAMELMV